MPARRRSRGPRCGREPLSPSDQDGTGMKSTRPIIAGLSWDLLITKPRGDLVGIEAEQVAPLQVGDSTLGDEPANVADRDAEMVGDHGDIEKGGETFHHLLYAHLSAISELPVSGTCKFAVGLGLEPRRSRHPVR